jgi:hypothetical protein
MQFESSGLRLADFAENHKRTVVWLSKRIAYLRE